jgi:hypothetical protein
MSELKLYNRLRKRLARYGLVLHKNRNQYDPNLGQYYLSCASTAGLVDRDVDLLELDQRDPASI